LRSFSTLAPTNCEAAWHLRVDVEMDYYAAWPVWKMPKWLGATLGGMFAVILGGSVWLIVDLTRPPAQRVTATVSAPAAAAPKVAAPARLVPAAVARTAPVEATPAAAPSAPAKKSIARTRDLSPTHKRAILAKHDAKSTRPRKDELDRLLGL
jgi:hypothetical protein